MEDVNQYDDIYLDQLLSNRKFREITRDYNLEVQDSFTFSFSRIILITK
jgi:hypothetical protein